MNTHTCSSKLCNKRILIIGHVTEIYGPVQALIKYSENNVGMFVSILHPLPETSIANSEYRVFLQGKYRKVVRKRVFRKSEAISYFQQALLNWFFVLRNRERYDICLGIDNLNAFCGIILRKLGFVESVIFYVIDYTPRRFDNFILNSSYHFLDKFCVERVDLVWNISRRIAKIRERQGVEKERNLIVPVGIELEKTRHAPRESIDRKVLVFVSHLTRSKGVDLVIEAMQDVIKKVPDVKLEIIGTGPHEKMLKELVKTSDLGNYVRFLGLMEHDKLMIHLPTRGVAIATYVDDPNSITYFADPTKPKEYLASGLPVIITRVPWIAKEIEEKHMGIAVNYDKRELVDAIIKLLKDDKFYERCRENIKTFSSELSWNSIFNKAFCESLKMQYVGMEW